jgi:pullulanase/glycogen debranching enzyme
MMKKRGCLILNNLRYWIEEMHIDGFRFDSATVFMRDTNGNFTYDPPILQAMNNDCIHQFFTIALRKEGTVS